MCVSHSKDRKKLYYYFKNGQTKVGHQIQTYLKEKNISVSYNPEAKVFSLKKKNIHPFLNLAFNGIVDKYHLQFRLQDLRALQGLEEGFDNIPKNINVKLSPEDEYHIVDESQDAGVAFAMLLRSSNSPDIWIAKCLYWADQNEKEEYIQKINLINFSAVSWQYFWPFLLPKSEEIISWIKKIDCFKHLHLSNVCHYLMQKESETFEAQKTQIRKNYLDNLIEFCNNNQKLASIFLESQQQPTFDQQQPEGGWYTLRLYNSGFKKILPILIQLSHLKSILLCDQNIGNEHWDKTIPLIQQRQTELYIKMYKDSVGNYKKEEIKSRLASHPYISITFPENE